MSSYTTRSDHPRIEAAKIMALKAAIRETSPGLDMMGWNVLQLRQELEFQNRTHRLLDDAVLEQVATVRKKHA